MRFHFGPTKRTTISERELVPMVALAMSLHAFAIDAMLPALDDMARDLGAAEGNERQLIVSLYLIGSGIGCLVPGAFADRFGRRPMLIFALAAYTVLSLILALIDNFAVMVVLRGLQGLACAGLTVVPSAIVRDRYDGDRMARLLSMIAAVFIIVPVIAPSIGQVVLLFAGWRTIFDLSAVLAALVMVWVWTRLPESLDPAHRQKVNVPVIVRNMLKSLSRRESIGYVLGAPLLMGAVFGYINSAQQLLGEHFAVGAMFPVIFGAVASTMAVTNIVNSRIVERFGARRVSHSGALVFIVVSLAQVWAAFYRSDSLAWFMPLLALNLGLLGFLGANFSSIALQPFGEIAGAAASMHAFVRMFGASLVGMAIGQSYDGTAKPFAFALLACSVSALLLVLYSERGKLFRRLIPPGTQRVC
ncbi:Bcr/CflA subfamily drug resistance transporter [Croceicoccus estronivorus]|uniref:multidrug effflux MFS transporter n=1 Tax=Croceicoccus estronivorus TaxID=1172626 RepID=UPI000834E0D4|nr:multidrug effflux MFS transporter [Croceicoccus estronivorus]OCC23686.1 Bcr/CflA subfamily drug resistance transporter [Croceicoccus estronivorus]